MEYEITKVIVCAVGGAIFAMALSSCGYTNGTHTIGTSGFLETANRGRLSSSYGAPMDHHTVEDKRKLEDVLRRY